MAVKKGDTLWWKSGMDNTGLKKGSAQAKGILKTLSSQITGLDIFAGLGASAVLAFSTVAKASWKMAKDFDLAMREVQTISGAAQDNFDGMKESVIAMSREVPEGAESLSKALYQIVSAGYDGAEGLNLLETSAKAAVAGVTDTITAADGLTTVMNAWGYASEEASRVADIMFQTVKLGKTTFDQIAGSISQVAALAASSSVSFEEVSASVATLTKQGVPTAVAMTQIRSALIGVTKELGDGWAEAMTLQEAFALVEERADGSQTAMLKMLGRIEAVNAVLGTTGKNAAGAAQDLQDMYESTGAAEKAFDLMTLAAENQIKVFKNRYHARLLAMGDDMIQVFGKVARSLNLRETIRGITDESSKVRVLASELTDANTSAERRLEIYEELEKIHPSIVEGINIEAGNYETLTTNVQDYNKALQQRIILETLKKEEVDLLAKQNKLLKEQAERVDDLRLEIIKVDEDIANSTTLTLDEKFRAAVKKIQFYHGEALYEMEKVVVDGVTTQQRALTETGRKTAELRAAYNQLTDAQEAYNEEAANVKPMQDRINRLREYIEELLNVEAAITKVTETPIDPGGGTKKLLKGDEFEDEVARILKIYEDMDLQIEAGLIEDSKHKERYHKFQLNMYKTYLEAQMKAYKGHTAQMKLLLEEYAKVVIEIKKNLAVDELEIDKIKYKDLEDAIQEATDRINKAQLKRVSMPLPLGDNPIWSDEAWNRFQNVAGEIDEIGRMFAGTFDHMGEILGEFDEEMGETVTELGRMAAGIGQLAIGLGTGDMMSVMTGFLNVIQAVIKLTKENDKQLEEMQARYDYIRKQIESINNALTRQLKILEQLNRTEYLETGAKTIEYIQRQMEILLEQMQAFETYISGAGRTGGAISLAGMSVDEIEELIDKSEFFGEQTEELLRETIDAYRGLQDDLKELELDIMEELIGERGIQSWMEEVISVFEEGGNAVENFADIFENAMKKAMTEAFKRQFLETQLQTFYDEFAKLTAGEWIDIPATGEGRYRTPGTRELVGQGLDESEIRLLKTLWESIMGDAADGWKDMEKLWESLGLVSDETEDILDSIEERVLEGISADTIADSIIEGFREGLTAAEIFANTFEDMMQDVVAGIFRKHFLDRAVGQFYDAFYEKAEDGLTEAEIAELREMYSDMIVGSKYVFEGLKDITGVDFVGQAEELERQRKTGLTGAIAGITEDTAGILAGQFMAMRFNIVEQVYIAEQSLDHLASIDSSTRQAALSLRRIEILSLRDSRHYGI